MGRILQPHDIEHVLIDIFNNLEIDKKMIRYSNIWSSMPINLPIIQEMYNVNITPNYFGYLMATLGAYQCEDILRHLLPGSYCMQLAIDKDGFYGIAILHMD